MNSHFTLLMWVKHFPTSAVSEYPRNGEKGSQHMDWHHPSTTERSTTVPGCEFWPASEMPGQEEPSCPGWWRPVQIWESAQMLPGRPI